MPVIGEVVRYQGTLLLSKGTLGFAGKTNNAGRKDKANAGEGDCHVVLCTSRNDKWSELERRLKLFYELLDFESAKSSFESFQGHLTIGSLSCICEEYFVI